MGNWVGLGNLELRISMVGVRILAKQRVETTLYSLSPTPPARPERRTGERYFSLLRVGALIVDGRRELCLIRNVSVGGMMIKPYSTIERGAALSVELKHGVTVSGQVQWSEGGLIGMTFRGPIDVVELLTSSADGPQPRMPRISLECPVTVREDGNVYRSRAINISQGGLCVQMDAELDLGAHVIISTSGINPTAGVLKWRDGDFYGIGFNRIFPIDELMSFLQGLQAQRAPLRAAG